MCLGNSSKVLVFLFYGLEETWPYLMEPRDARPPDPHGNSKLQNGRRLPGCAAKLCLLARVVGSFIPAVSGNLKSFDDKVQILLSFLRMHWVLLVFSVRIHFRLIYQQTHSDVFKTIIFYNFKNIKT